MTTVDEAREALLAKLTSDWDMDPWGEYEAAKKRLTSDLDALIAAVRAEREGLVEALEAFMVAFEETGVHEHERDDNSIDLCIPIAPLKPVYWAACAAVGHRWTVVDVEPFCERCGFRDRLAAIEAAAARREREQMTALAVGWVAYTHGYIKSSGDSWHTATNWTDCQMHPCAQARAILAAMEADR